MIGEEAEEVEESEEDVILRRQFLGLLGLLPTAMYTAQTPRSC